MSDFALESAFANKVKRKALNRHARNSLQGHPQQDSLVLLLVPGLQPSFQLVRALPASGPDGS